MSPPNLQPCEDSPPEVTVRWLDPDYLETGGRIAAFERERKFSNIGSAVAWARRKIIRGNFLPETVEVSVKGGLFSRTRVFDIFVDGVREWQDADTFSNTFYLRDLEQRIVPHRWSHER